MGFLNDIMIGPLSLAEAAVLAAVALYVGKVICKRMNWLTGVAIIEDLESGLSAANKYIMQARGSGDIVLDMEKAAIQAASRMPGVTVEKIKPIIRKLALRQPADYKGLKISINGDGKVSIDPSGLVNQGAHKVGKWLKKVF